MFNSQFESLSDDQMKKLILFCVLFILIATPIALADSSITIEATINEDAHVTLKFAYIEQELYGEIKDQGFNISTIPNAIEEEFKQQDLANARVIYDLNQEIFNDDTQSIFVKFLLAGSDIVSYTLNRADMTRTFRVRTDWRKFEINFTHSFSLNLEEDFGVPLTEWKQVDYKDTNEKVHTAYERSIEEDSIEVTFRFILPEKAFDIQAEEDTIIFKFPPVFENALLNSPFLILGAIIIANIIAVVYRKVKR